MINFGISALFSVSLLSLIMSYTVYALILTEFIVEGFLKKNMRYCKPGLLRVQKASSLLFLFFSVNGASNAFEIDLLGIKSHCCLDMKQIKDNTV